MDLLTLALLFFGTKLAKGKATADKLEFYPLNLELIHGKLVFTMEILNPTGNPLKIDSFFGGVFANDKKIGSIERGKPFTLKKKGRTPVTFPVKLVGTGIIQTLLSGSKKYKFKIMGVAHALGVDTPINQELSLLT